VGWLNPAWSYRKTHVIGPASGAGVDYQIRVVAHFGAGADAGEDVYLDSKSRTDFGDLRFTDSTGVTLLSYWIEEEVDSDYAICWIKVSDDLGVYDREICVYYGNGAATSVANGDNTFIFFDDFEIDLSKWTKLGLPVVSADHAYSGIKSVKFPALAAASIQKLGGPTTNHAVHAHLYDAMDPLLEYTVFSFDAGELETSYLGIITDGADYEYMLNGTTYDSGIPRGIGWHELIARMSPGLKEFVIDGNLMPVSGTGNYGAIIIVIQSVTSQVAAYWDAVFETKYVSPEPAHGVWGLEETSPGISTFVAEDIVPSLPLGAHSMDDVVLSLIEAPHLAEDPLLTLLLGGPHPPFTAEDVLLTLAWLRSRTVEDPMFTLPLSLHVPILAEDILLALTWLRNFRVPREFDPEYYGGISRSRLGGRS